MRRAIFATVAFLFVASVVIEVLRIQYSWESPVTEEFRLSGEQSLPNWLSSVILLVDGACLLVIAAHRRGLKDRFAKHWTALGIIFCYMSADESASIHEILNGNNPLKNSIYFPWVFVGGAFVLIVGMSYVPFLLALPRRRAVQFVVSGAVYVGSALGMEFPLGAWAHAYGEHSLGYRLIDTVEEAGEIVGMSLFLFALLEELAVVKPELVVETSSEEGGRS